MYVREGVAISYIVTLYTYEISSRDWNTEMASYTYSSGTTHSTQNVQVQIVKGVEGLLEYDSLVFREMLKRVVDGKSGDGTWGSPGSFF